ncbi:hypothetical protein [Cellulomonas marina]|uniref:DUF8094 domain-containing protein n=1 Tax=Cellulomonas marina TaxID=988821 RepID=A0A1I1AYI1_9CELL|nr:hypothetical protein [Cellulomonas marina]GIG30228.1 hypothetical protein Cma02nite_28280 [Cellulomonas marina]SFB41323.1 hypothetical protein SAMN05421867_12247 [Cellulomonas marina]
MSRLPARSRRRGARAAAVLLPGLLVVAGCATPLPEPVPAPAPAVAPATLAQTQLDRVLGDLGAVLADADATSDAARLAPRVEGPALRTRTAEYVRATATSGQRGPTPLPVTPASVLVPATTQWPRSTLVVTEQPADLQAPRILVLRQDDARSPYRLWGWARLLPGVQLPATAGAGTGVPVLDAGSEALRLAPEAVLDQYADVLTNGDASAAAPTFASDAFREGLVAARTQAAANVQAVGSVTETSAAVPDSVVALGTLDGGALVVGQLTTTTTFTVSQGSLTLDATDAALSGKTSVSRTLVYTYDDVLAFYVPPAGSTDQVRLLAAEHARVGVTGE